MAALYIPLIQGKMITLPRDMAALYIPLIQGKMITWPRDMAALYIPLIQGKSGFCLRNQVLFEFRNRSGDYS